MSQQLEMLWQRWRALATRERWLVGAASLLLLLSLGQVAWRSGHGALDDLRADVTAQRESLELARVLDATGPAAARNDEPLLALAERSARESGIGGALKRLDGGEGGRIRARLEAAPFGTVVRWLATVQASSGASIESLALERGADPGLVDANIVLAPAGR
jgi:type II secretory pathway component PulM